MGTLRQEEGEASGDLEIAHPHLGLFHFDLNIPFASVEAVQPRHCHYRTRRGSRLLHTHYERSRGLQLRRQPIHSDVVALLVVRPEAQQFAAVILCHQASSVVTPRFVASISV